MNKKIYFIIATTIIFIMVLFMLTDKCLASTISTSGIGVSQSTTTEFDKIGSVILGAIQGIGIGVSVITLVVIGIKYMTGSVEEKAEYKKHMGPYITGVIFLALCTTIPNIIYNIVK